MIIYLSGPMTGLPDHNRTSFEVAAAQLRFEGHTVVNPSEFDFTDYHEDWQACLKRDLKAMLDCEAIMLLPEFHHSRGAMLEFHVGIQCGLKFYFWEHWLKGLYKLADRG